MTPSWPLQRNIITKTSSTLTNSPIQTPYELQDVDYSFLNVTTSECYVLSWLVGRSSIRCDALPVFSSRYWLEASGRSNVTQCPMQATSYFYIGMIICDGNFPPAILSMMCLKKKANKTISLFNILSCLDHHLFSLPDNCCNSGSFFIYCIQQVNVWDKHDK
jgi:hypothetical protein